LLLTTTPTLSLTAIARNFRIEICDRKTERD